LMMRGDRFGRILKRIATRRITPGEPTPTRPYVRVDQT